MVAATLRHALSSVPGAGDSVSVIVPFGGPDEEDPEFYPDPSCEFPPFGDVSAGDDDEDDG